MMNKEKKQLHQSRAKPSDQQPDLSGSSINLSRRVIGCAAEADAIKRNVELLLNPNLVGQNILIVGPVNTGKTFVTHRIASSYKNRNLNYIYLDASRTLDKEHGNVGSLLKEIFEIAITKPPTLLFIDKIDAICEKKRYSNEVGRVFTVLQNGLENLRNLEARVLVLAATNRPEVLDDSIHCHFSDKIKFSLPSLADRCDKLTETLTRFNAGFNPISSKEVDRIAEATHCYSHYDTVMLCMRAMGIARGATIEYKHFKEALTEFRPSRVASVTSPCPQVKWNDIGGVKKIKEDLEASVIMPLKYPDQFGRLGLTPIRGILLYGPPGCSKTMLAQALATESGYNFISIKGPELNSKYVGESEAAVRKLYRNAREIAPCIIFFDELEAMAPERTEDSNSPVGDRVTAQLLTELNGVEPLQNVFTIAATNRPNKVDSALLRPGRLDPAIYVPLPSREDRIEIFLVHMRKLKQLKICDEDLDEFATELADKTNYYSGADIARVCQAAGEIAWREDPTSTSKQIERQHFYLSLDKVKPKTRPAQLKAFAKFHEMTIQLGQRESFAADSPNVTFFSEEFHKLKLDN